MRAKKIVTTENTEKKTEKTEAISGKTVVARKVRSRIKRDGLTIDVYDIKGKVVDTITLSKEIFGQNNESKI